MAIWGEWFRVNGSRFRVTKEEFENWKSQIVISNIYSQEELASLKMGARKYPNVFTEQGVAQLSAVLHSDVAAEASVMIKKHGDKKHGDRFLFQIS